MKTTKLYRSEYKALTDAKSRCHCITHPFYSSYGGRNIHVAPEWRAKGGFDLFLEHIGPKADPSLSLDRIDNDKGYEPGNVRWATAREQAANRRKPRPNRLPDAAFEKRRDAIRAERAAGLAVRGIAERHCLTTKGVYALLR